MNAQVEHVTGYLEPHEPQQSRAVVTTPDHLLSLAVEKGADLDRLEKLMDLKIKWEANEARKAFHSAMAAFKAQPLVISKDKHVKFQTAKGLTEYDHATLGNVVRVVVPALAQQGLSHSWITERAEGGRIQVTCKITHALGHSESIALDAGLDDSGGKNNIQALGSAIAYLQRYTLLAITGLATEDQDDDGGSTSFKAEDFITPEQEATLADLIAESATDKAKFLDYWKVQKIAELLKTEYEPAVKLLRQKIAAKATQA